MRHNLFRVSMYGLFDLGRIWYLPQVIRSLLEMSPVSRPHQSCLDFCFETLSLVAMKELKGN